MLTRFLAFLNTNALLPPAQRVLVAVSGGLDSVILADLFHRAGLPMGVAHVNFGLRGAESDEDAVFVRSLAATYGVDFHLFAPDTLAYAAANGVSVQMAARELRYDFFDRTATESDYGAIATAHHQHDLAETLLLNLTRGTGLAGLHGIRPRRGRLIRPLLFTNRAELEAYAHQRHLPWREDSSNATDKYARNQIRHHVLPVLAALNPGLPSSMTATAHRLRAAEVLMRQELDRSWAAIATDVDGQIRLDKHQLANLPEPAFRLGEWLRPFGFGEAQSQLIAELLPGPHVPADRIGQVFRSATHQLINDRTTFTLAPLPTDPARPVYLNEPPAPGQSISVQLPGAGYLTLTCFERPAGFVPPPDATIACLAADTLSWPLLLRPWQLGDRFRPLGMKGSKLVSDLLNDRKVTATQRANTWVLVLADGQIGWVTGHRLAQGVALSAATNQIVRLQLEPMHQSVDR